MNCDKCKLEKAKHKIFREGILIYLCCHCYIAEGYSPADWHSECIAGD